jgi:hypothetical protein
MENITNTGNFRYQGISKKQNPTSQFEKWGSGNKNIKPSGKGLLFIFFRTFEGLQTFSVLQPLSVNYFGKLQVVFTI